ncbi:ABC transporter permease [Streptomyces sp. NBC_00335]|uniref:ABC transporter permease n=1 Tax=unclassified Streptomyces TaxID=2593676 RepID=UPI002254260F|nr:MULTISPECIES: ABC transporter permease [unclassified Streptomyces]MCX5402572.1 ABC transporter permease [Streptomyces sp. NBC_00086]
MSTLTLKGPYWVAARQHRRVLWAVPILLAVGLVVMVALRVWSAYPTYDAMHRPLLTPGYDLLRGYMQSATRVLVFLPLLVGAFVAGPMIARELESGTWRLALTQSTTAKAWLGSKVLVAAAVSVLGSLALIGIYRLGWTQVSDTYELYWYERGVYAATGPVLVAYCLLGVAIAALVGQLVRRTLPAMAVAGLLTGLVLLVLSALRWSFLPVVAVTAPYTVDADSLLPPSAKNMGTGLTLTTGERASGYRCFPEPPTSGGCRDDMDATASYADFHPTSHYWPTQLIETSIVLVLAAAVLYAAFRLVQKRHP